MHACFLYANYMIGQTTLLHKIFNFSTFQKQFFNKLLLLLDLIFFCYCGYPQANIKKKCKDKGYLYFETSAKNGENVELAFLELTKKLKNIEFDDDIGKSSIENVENSRKENKLDNYVRKQRINISEKVYQRKENQHVKTKRSLQK